MIVSEFVLNAGQNWGAPSPIGYKMIVLMQRKSFLDVQNLSV